MRICGGGCFQCISIRSGATADMLVNVSITVRRFQAIEAGALTIAVYTLHISQASIDVDCLRTLTKTVIVAATDMPVGHFTMP